jgi:RNA polymerase sigma-70 factor, ECF subfamily
VLVMTFYDDRPADAVAQELKLSAGNVRVIRHRGLERLRGCMTAEEGAA